MSVYTTVARPYAKAAFEYAVASDACDTWSALLQKAALIVSDPRVVTLFSSPQVTQEEKRSFLVELLEEKLGNTEQSKLDLDKEQKNFIALLTVNHRLMAISEITHLFDQYVRESKKIIDVEVTSAFPIDDDQKKRLSQALHIRLQQKINLNVNVDSSIIGGAVIRAGDFVIDGSCQEQLERMRYALLA